MKRKQVLRIGTRVFSAFSQAARGTDKEYLAFLVAVPVQGETETIYLAHQLLLPDAGDLSIQTSTRVAPSMFFQGVAHLLTHLHEQAALIDLHTHPGDGPVSFSAMDEYGSTIDAEVAKTCFSEAATTGSVVFNHTLDRFEGKIFIKDRDTYEPIDTIEILGAPTTILKARTPSKTHSWSHYHRQTLIPWLRQERLASLNVGIIGAGGIGSMVLTGFINSGVGERGRIVNVDNDRLEISNVSRIPYASPRDVGTPKVKLAARYARQRKFKGTFIAKCTHVQDPALLPLLKEVHLLIGAVDNARARKALNEIAVRYAIPFVDFGSEIFIDQVEQTDSGGQVRIVLPGETGCLICAGGISQEALRREQMDEPTRRDYEKAGYIHGTDQSPAPAVNSLNGVVAYLGLSQILKMICQKIDGDSSLFYQQENHQLIAAGSTLSPRCPVCGEGGVLAAGDRVDKKDSPIENPNIRVIDSQQIVPGGSMPAEPTEGQTKMESSHDPSNQHGVPVA